MTKTLPIAYAITKQKTVLTSGTVTCEEVSKKWVDVITGEIYKKQKIAGKEYFIDGGGWK